MKKAYYYLYYKIYKSIQFRPSLSYWNFWVDWKAELGLNMLWLFVISSLFIYFQIFINPSAYLYLENRTQCVTLLILIVCVPNYFIFHYKNQWKEVVEEFDKLPKRKNLIGGIMVRGLIILIVANLIFSYYLLIAKAKENHTGPYSKEYIEQQKTENSR